MCERVSKLPTTETSRIYRPQDFKLGAKKLFPKDKGGWAGAASDAGYLRIRPDLTLGLVGLYGSLALGNPPTPTDIDAWEGAKPKDCWDYYSCLDFLSVPAAGPRGGLEVVLFHSHDSFAQRPLEIVGRVHLTRTAYELGAFNSGEDLDDVHSTTGGSQRCLETKRRRPRASQSVRTRRVRGARFPRLVSRTTADAPGLSAFVSSPSQKD